VAAGQALMALAKRKRLPCFCMAVRVGERVPCVGSTPRWRNRVVLLWPGERVTERSAPVELSCPHCDQPDATLLRLVLIGELLAAEESQLLRLAAVMQQCGLLQLSPEPDPALVQTRQATLHYLQQAGPQGEER